MQKQFNQYTPEEWFHMFRNYQRQLQQRLRVGCEPTQYQQLSMLEQALTLVIRRFERQGFDRQCFEKNSHVALINSVNFGEHKYDN